MKNVLQRRAASNPPEPAAAAAVAEPPTPEQELSRLQTVKQARANELAEAQSEFDEHVNRLGGDAAAHVDKAKELGRKVEIAQTALAQAEREYTATLNEFLESRKRKEAEQLRRDQASASQELKAASAEFVAVNLALNAAQARWLEAKDRACVFPQISGEISELEDQIRLQLRGDLLEERHGWRPVRLFNGIGLELPRVHHRPLHRPK